MIKSMTGYGIASFENDQMSMQIEIKSLNAKFLDISLKLSKEAAPYEQDLKTLLSKTLIRGKVMVSIETSLKSIAHIACKLNRQIFEHYRHEIQSVMPKEASTIDVAKEVLRFQEVFELPKDLPQAVDQAQLLAAFQQALAQLEGFRRQEGKATQQALNSYIESIQEKLTAIEKQSPKRITQVRQKMDERLSGLSLSAPIDPNRFEQELIYYLEKMDISEEIVRLQSHVAYFHETMRQEETPGRKLGFISQEMGREMNTIGAKANDSYIQKLVVDMKDNLEKIKEQVLNII